MKRYYIYVPVQGICTVNGVRCTVLGEPMAQRCAVYSQTKETSNMASDDKREREKQSKAKLKSNKVSRSKQKAKERKKESSSSSKMLEKTKSDVQQI